jgi:hypothetical protein
MVRKTMKAGGGQGLVVMRNGETEREIRIRINRNGTPDSSGSPAETVACCRMNAAFRRSREEAD